MLDVLVVLPMCRRLPVVSLLLLWVGAVLPVGLGLGFVVPLLCRRFRLVLPWLLPTTYNLLPAT